jgi:hypothetical protein
VAYFYYLGYALRVLDGVKLGGHIAIPKPLNARREVLADVS